MWWVNTSDELLSKHLLNIYLLPLLPYEVINILKLHMLFLTIFTQSFYSDIHISIYMQFSYSGYVSTIWGWEKIILNVMSKNPGYVTDQDFPSSDRGGGNQKSLLGGDFFSLGCGKLRRSAFDHVRTFFKV